MDTLDFAQLTVEETAQRFLGLTPDQIQTTISQLSAEQIAAVFSVLDENHTESWPAKLRAALMGLSDYHKLEYAGQNLSVFQFLELLDYFGNASFTELWKLSPLCVGIPHAIFKEALLRANPQQLHVMKITVIHEPIQHQLTLLSHELVHQLPVITEHITSLEQTIDRLGIKDMGYKELKAIRSLIDQTAVLGQETLKLISRILALAWNTNRADLIEKLSQAKELYQRYYGSIVGTSRTSAAPATGLFAMLDAKVLTAFGNPDDPNDIEAAENDEPALEALVKFSVWYPKDYWDIGLLPHIVDPDLFDHIEKRLGDQEAQKKHEDLYDFVRFNLNKIGLNTVGDLKQAGIFSRKSLEEYIQRNSYLLRT